MRGNALFRDKLGGEKTSEVSTVLRPFYVSLR